MKHSMMKKGALTVALFGTLMIGSAAHAQGGFGGGQGGRRGGMGNMTPEQQQQMMQRMQEAREQQTRTQLTALGYNAQVQDAIIEFTKAKDTAATDLREKGQAMVQGMMGAMPDASKPLTDLKTLVDGEKARRAAAEKDLDAKIGYSKDPKLELYLRLTGVIGDDASVLGIGGGGRGGRGFGGGGMGGFGGGQGGFGGGQGGRRRGGQGGAGDGANANA